MQSADQIKDILKKNLSLSRYTHSIGVQKIAIKLAKKYNISVQKAAIAGLVHDCAKELTDKELLKYAAQFGILIDDILYRQSQLLHGVVGMEVAKRKFKIRDEEILNAIKFHTTGKESMTVLEKIIYVADHIESRKSSSGIEILMEKAFSDLDKALLMAMDNTIKYIISKGELIHPLTIQARNFILLQTETSR